MATLIGDAREVGHHSKNDDDNEVGDIQVDTNRRRKFLALHGDDA